MKILIIHNSYGKFSGEEAVVESQAKLLQANGHTVVRYERSSAEIVEMRLGAIRAFASGIYSRTSRRQMRQLLAQHKPDIVNIHNLYPLISPSILRECRAVGVPVLMTVHNYRLVCPNGLHMVDGQVCEKCRGGKEYWCVFRNCEGSLFKSLGYALRTYTARKFRLFTDNVTIYVPLTEFHRNRLISEGIPPERITVIPNMVSIDHQEKPYQLGDYVGYVGRVSPEKGVLLLLTAAAMNPAIPFKIAGSYDRMMDLVKTATPNVEFLGHLGQPALERFYAGCRIVVMPSLCYETFGLPLAEAGIRSKPVICSRIGGLPEIVDDVVTGLLFESGSADDLGEKIKTLWGNPVLCKKMGQAGREKVLREYSPEKYYERLMAVYEKAIRLAPARLKHNS